MPIPYASIPSASLKLASFLSEVPAGRIAIFSLAKENIPTLGSPKMSDSITGTALSLARKDYDSPLLVLHNSDSNFPGRLAYSSLPEHAVRLLAQRDFGCLHPLSHEFAQESDGSRSPFLQCLCFGVRRTFPEVFATTHEGTGWACLRAWDR